jgi:type VI protein secretion system component Hcp
MSQSSSSSRPSSALNRAARHVRARRVAAPILAALGASLVPTAISSQPAGAQGTSGYEVFLVLPDGAPGVAKTSSSSKGEPLTAFTLSVAASGAPSGSLGLGAGQLGQSTQASATMAIDPTSISLMQEVSTAQALTLEVDFWKSNKGALVRFLTYKFANAAITSYVLQDSATGQSVQIAFTFKQIQESTFTSTGTPSTATWSITTVRAV